jgi:hypothetical protein
MNDEIGGEKESRREFLKRISKIRKTMPPPEKVIKPKTEFKRERFDWRNSIDDEQ